MHGLDARAKLVDNVKATAIVADAPNDRAGVIVFHLPAGDARLVDLRVLGEDHADSRGQAAIKVLALPSRTTADRIRLAALRLEAQGCATFAQGDAAALAAAEFESASHAWLAIGDRVRAGRALQQGAGARYSLGDQWAQAAQLAAKSASLLDGTDETELRVRAARLEGAALHALAGGRTGAARAQLYRAARTRLTEAAALAMQAHLPYEAAYAINYRGVTHQYEGLAAEARADYEHALALFREAGHAPGESISIDGLALLHHEQGEYRAALRRFDEALALTSAAESPESYASTLYNSALPLRALGRFDEAIERYQRAAALRRKSEDPAGEARALHGVALALRYAGEPERARVLLLEALSLQQQVKNSRDTFSGLVALADIEREQGRWAEAEALLRQAEPLAGRPYQQARVLLGLGAVAATRGDAQAARAQFERLLAIELPASHPGRGEAWLALADVEARAGRSEEARRAYDQALEVALANATGLAKARALTARARFRVGLGELDGAIDDTAHAIDQLEAVGVAGLHGQQRAIFMATQRQVYEWRIAALLGRAERQLRDGRAREAAADRRAALVASERSRTEGLVESLAASGTRVPLALLDRRQELVELLAGKRDRIESLLDRPSPDTAVVAGLKRDVEWLRAELRSVEARIARSQGVTPKGAAEVDAEALTSAVPAGTAVVEYFIGEHQGWVFTIRADDVSVQSLSATATIETAVRALLSGWRAMDPAAKLDEALEQVSGVFPGPLQLAEPVERVWVVPDGPLHALPLASLSRLASAESWLKTAEIVVIPSLRAVVTASRSARSQTEPKLLLALVADPIFDRGDPRIAGGSQPATEETAMPLPLGVQTRTAVRINTLQRLPATGVEARAIEALVPQSRRLTLIGAEATRGAVLGLSGHEARYLHFATHAFADSEDPELSALVLSRYDRDGQPTDGLLRLADLQSLRIDAELVVLSGCETALGREIGGEGLVGLSRGFLQAGARTVVASLWQVPDTATAVLMQAFYRQLLVEDASPARALQHAQDHVRSQPRWATPYYWAGFQVVTLVPSGSDAKPEARGMSDGTS